MNYPLIVTEQYVKESKKWLTAIKRRENAVVTFFPKTDRLLRMQQLLENPKDMQPVLGEISKYLFLVFEIGIHNVEESRDLYNHIAGKLNYNQQLTTPWTFEQWVKYLKESQMNLILVIPQIEKLWSVEGHMAQNALTSLVNDYFPLISTLSFSEQDLMHPSMLAYLPNSMRLYQNIYYYPLYSSSDSLKFIRYLQVKWNMKVKKEVEERILKDCGGHFWLLKEAQRECEAYTYPLYPEEGLKFRLEVLFQQLETSEQNVLEKIIRGQEHLTKEEQHSLSYLQKMNVISKNKKCLIELLNDYILNRNKSATQMTLKENRIILNQIPLDKFFSRKEYRVVRILLEKRGEVVLRDELARHIWPANTQEHYSDWAIDQLIARVRRRFQHLSLSPKMLRSVRGKGYLLDLS